MSDDKKNNFFKICIITGSTIIGLVIIGAGYAWLRPVAAPEKKVIKQMSGEAKTQYLASDDFGKLDSDEKSKVLKDMRNGSSRRGMGRNMRNLSKESRDKMRKNMRPVMKKMMQERLDKFFKMSQGERNKELDKMIDRMEQWRKRREQAGAGNRGGGTGGGGPGRGRRGGGDIGRRMSMILEESSSDSRAKMSEFFKQMRARRDARKKK